MTLMESSSRKGSGNFLLGPAILFLGIISGALSAGIPTDTFGNPSGPSKSKQSFRQALPGHRYLFPQDHGSHDDFQIEWWYYTGHLVAQDGRRFGYQLTFFRSGVDPDLQERPAPSRWTINHLYLAHFALSDIDNAEFQYAEKLSRAGLGKAGAETGRLKVWIDRWEAAALSPDHARQRLRASAGMFGIDLFLSQEKPPVMNGKDGISRKGDQPGQASHYYSLTRLATEGTLSLGGKKHAVTGLSWMDHEFGSAELGENLVGWDWFSVQLNDRTELMCYLLRRQDGTPDLASSGTFVSASGHPQHLTQGDLHLEVLDYWVSPTSGARYPSHWRLLVPRLKLSLELTPLMANQELTTDKSTRVTYWEGAVRVAGMRAGEEVAGHGYVELTGYAERFTPRL